MFINNPVLADIAFLSLARNCAKTLPAYLQMLRDLRASGMHCIAYVGENGSKDGTNILLREAEQRGELTLISTNFMAEMHSRMHRMAAGRQHLKEVHEKSDLKARFICIADIDNVIQKPPSATAIRDAMIKLASSDIFGVSATSRPSYYDVSAYEDDIITFELLPEKIEEQKRDLFRYHKFFKQNVYPHQRRLTSDREIICTSAFNGLCIYNADAYAHGSYLDSDFRRCEHLTLNRQIAKITGARMLIDPGLVLVSPTEHTEKMLIPFIWRRAQALLGHKLKLK